MHSLVAQVLSALESNAGHLQGVNCDKLIRSPDEVVLTPAILAGIGKLRESESQSGLVSAWKECCSPSSTSTGDCRQQWAAAFIFRRTSLMIDSSAAEVAALCRQCMVSCVPSFESLNTLPVGLELRGSPDALTMSSEAVGAAASHACHPVLRWKSSALPAWLRAFTWRTDRRLPFSSDSSLSVSLWHALVNELLNVLACIRWEGVESIPDVARDVVVCCAIESHDLPWSSELVAPAAEALFSSTLPLCSRSSDGPSFFKFSRSVVKTLADSQRCVVSSALAVVLDAIPAAVSWANSLGHCFPLLLPLIDDFRPVFQWIGLSSLRKILQSCTSAGIAAHGPLLLESFRRASTSSDCAVLSLVYELQIHVQLAVYGPPPHDSFDKLFSDIVTRLASQSKTEMHVVFFAVASTLSVTMGVHIARHMGVLIDVCTTAIKSVYSLPVVLAGVHTLHTLVVSCWPRFTTLALQSRVLNALRAAAEAAPRLCTEGETDGPDWCAAVLATAEMVQKLLSSLITVPAIQ